MANPYESPQAPDANRPPNSKPFLTRQRVFRFGLGGIVSALVMATGSQALFVESRQLGGAWDTSVVVIDVVAALLFFGGIVALVIYHWFPDPNRKYSWRQKHSDKQGPTEL